MNMNYSYQKICLGIITLGISCIAIELIPIARQASYWNRCLDNTIAWVNEANDLKEWSSVAKESLAAKLTAKPPTPPKANKVLISMPNDFISDRPNTTKISVRDT